MALRRRLSQNLLMDTGTAQSMAIAALEGLVPGRINVVELGAGASGAITRHLCDHAPSSLLAVEVDQSAASRLREFLGTFRADAMATGTVVIDTCDMLSLDWAALSGKAGNRLVVVSNVPFGLSSQLLYSLADAAPSISRCVLILQREVAERLCAVAGVSDTARGGGGAYSSLTVEYSLRCAANSPRILSSIPRQAFMPSPKVETCIVQVDFDEARARAASVSEEAAVRRRQLLAAAFARRAQPLALSWAPVLAHASPAASAALAAPEVASLLAKRPWEVEPLEFDALALALAAPFAAALASGVTLDISRGPPRPPQSGPNGKGIKKKKLSGAKAVSSASSGMGTRRPLLKKAGASESKPR